MTGIRIEDIDALDEFRAHLLSFNRELAESFAAIRSHWRAIGDIWTDDMYRKFGDALEEVTPGIERYLAATEGHEAHLAGRIQRFRDVVEYGGG
jgi:hypothetical protein